MPSGRHPAEHRMSTADWDGVSNLLLVRLDNIGDVILLGPAIRSLRTRLPEARMTLLASPAGAQIAPLVPGIDDVITYRAEWQSVGGAVSPEPQAFLDLIDRLAEKCFDAAVIFTSFSQSPHPVALAAYLAGIPLRIGQSKEFGGDLLTHWVTPLADGLHQADRNLFLLDTAGVPTLDTRLELHVPEAARARVRLMLAAEGVGSQDRVVLGVPGASCAARRYDAACFADAMALVAASTDARVIMAGSENERWMAGLAVNRSERIVSLAGRTSVPDLVALVDRTDLAIVANSSSLHIADALGTPTVVLYSGAEETEQWRARHTPSVLLGRTTECAPCHEFTCPRAMQCLDLPPREVAEHALGLLGERSASAWDPRHRPTERTEAAV